ncbi:MAG: zf-HC2 domain-containing protein [Candidatus Zixiibacteriota bacterium]
MRHLTDIEIQDYIDGNLPGMTEKIEEHLHECADCRKTAREYQIIFNQLNADFTPVLAPNFAKAVMERVAPNVVPVKKRDLSFALYLGVSLISLVVTFYFIGFERLLSIFQFQVPSLSVGEYMESFFAPMEKYFNFDFSYIVYTILALAIIGAVDYAFRHRPRKPISYMV